MLSLINVQGSLYRLSSLYEEDSWPGDGQEKLKKLQQPCFLSEYESNIKLLKYQK